MLKALLAERRLARTVLTRALEQAQGRPMCWMRRSRPPNPVWSRRATIWTAPFTGSIVTRSVQPGQLIRAGDALFEIADLSVVTLNALVPIAQAKDLRPGIEADFWFPEDPAVRVTGRLVRIGAEAASGTRAVPVWFKIDNRTPGLRAGSFLVGEAVLRRDPDALREADGTTQVLAIRDGLAALVPVRPGDASLGGMVGIREGLVAGDLVVRLPLSGLSPGEADRGELSRCFWRASAFRSQCSP